MKKLISLCAFLFCFTYLAMDACSQVNVISGGNGLLPAYASLTNAGGLFADLNANDQTGQIIVISVTGNSAAEAGTNALTGAAGMWTSLSITPNGAWTISGTVAAPLIDLSGADNVTIDGLNTGGNSLTISNTNSGNATTTSTIRFIGGASNNTVTNCSVLGSFSGSLATNGGNIFFSTTGTSTDGNDDNTISNCNIGPAGQNLPTKCIYGNGSQTGAARNERVIINNNNIFDFFSATLSVSGIHILSGNDDWTISNNRIYQTAARTFTSTALRYAGITLNATAGTFGSFTVTGNTIGFGASNGTGTTTISGSTNTFRGIDAINVNTTTPTSIQGNTISGISQTTATTSTGIFTNFVGMMLGITNGRFDVGTITGNNVGSLNGSSTITVTTSAGVGNVTGIYDASTQSNSISNNNIGHITIQGASITGGFRGILVNTASAALATVNNNTISNISNTKVGNYSTYGIQISFTSTTMIGNIVRNMTTNANGASVVVMAGIVITNSTATRPSNVEKNRIYSLLNTVDNANSNSIYGIDVTFPLFANEVKQNYVYGLSIVASNAACQLWGFVRRVGGNATVYNNMISLGLNTDGSSITTGYSILGMFDRGGGTGSYSYYYNSIFIGGTGVLSASNSVAMSSNVTTNVRNFVNNILINARSNTSAGGAAHYAIQLGGTGVNPTGLTSNYNDLYVSGTDGVVGLYDGVDRNTLADWQLATGQDANSSSVPVSFFNPAAGNLHLDGSSVGDEELIGIPIPGIDTDIDKQLRNLEFPYMGADEGAEPLPVELASFISSVNGRDVNLIWATTSESNNAGFEIERSLVNGSWSKIGNVAGNGTTSSSSNYTFTDRSLASGNYSYRLKQIDFNGNFEYFNLSNEVNVGVPSKFDLSQNYPNPFNPTTNLDFGISKLGFVSLKVYDASGKEVATLVNEIRPAGYYSVNFNGSGFSSGVYFYRLSAGDFTATKKMTLIK